VRTIPIATQAMLDSWAHTLAFGMMIIRNGDGDVSGWTEHDVGCEVTVAGDPLTLDPINALTISSLVSEAGFAVGNLEVTVLQFDEYLTKADLLDGFWTGSEFLIFQYDYKAPDEDVIPRLAGTFGRVKPKLGQYVIELRDVRQFIATDTTRITQANCDYDYGDPNTCTIDLSAGHTFTGTVTSVETPFYAFTDSGLAGADDKFTQGSIEWLTGLNAGSRRKVRAFATGGVITLVLPMLRDIQVGDTFEIIEGCLKRRADCIDKGNILNFPGSDQKLKTDAMIGGATVEP
jgi:uncharacterized phage protein (TIGR02218 family)